MVAAEIAGRVVEAPAEWRWTPGDTARVAVAGVTLVIGGVVASGGAPPWEQSAFLKINALPDQLYPILWPLMQLGNVWVASVAALLAAFVVRPWASRFVVAATPVAAWMIAKVIKDLVDRGRPAAVGLVVDQRGAAESGLGFVSGHATVAFALAAAVAAHLRRPWSAVPMALAALVGVARIFVGVHLPLDVVGGAALGLLIGEASRVVELTRTRVARHAHDPHEAAPLPR